MNIKRWQVRPEGANWGDFGADDQRGRLNLITPQRRRQAAQEVREGIAFCLSLPLDRPGGNVLSSRRYPPVLRPTRRGVFASWNYHYAQEDPQRVDVICDDAVVLHNHYSTHWDALCHVGQLFDSQGDGQQGAVYYNGYRAQHDIYGPAAAELAGANGIFDATSTSHARALGIDAMARSCVQGRGVLIDLHAHCGRERRRIGYDELMRILDADRVVVEAGDMVCVYTGYADLLLEMQGTPDLALLNTSCAVLDGNDMKLLDWITRCGLCVIAADNYAVEDFPASRAHDCCSGMPLHAHCLFKLGVHLGELWHLAPLARWLREHHRSRFLLTAPPLNLPGASASPLTPVATV